MTYQPFKDVKKMECSPSQIIYAVHAWFLWNCHTPVASSVVLPPKHMILVVLDNYLAEVNLYAVKIIHQKCDIPVSNSIP